MGGTNDLQHPDWPAGLPAPQHRRRPWAGSDIRRSSFPAEIDNGEGVTGKLARALSAARRPPAHLGSDSHQPPGTQEGPTA